MSQSLFASAGTAAAAMCRTRGGYPTGVKLAGAAVWCRSGEAGRVVRSPATSGVRHVVVCARQRHQWPALPLLSGPTASIFFHEPPNLCIHYGRTKDSKIEGRQLNRLWGWVAADFAADLDTCLSHTGYVGYVIMINGGPISWKSVKQKRLSLSTAESEW